MYKSNHELEQGWVPPPGHAPALPRLFPPHVVPCIINNNSNINDAADDGHPAGW